jgi:uncharacterized protein YbjT (DUF2867 family)
VSATPGAVTIDFCRDLDPATWRPRLAGIDAVINTVGVLRDTRARPMQQVHAQAPIALFEACAAAGVRRVIHISALGIDASETAYARTKRTADARLLALTHAGRLDGVVLRPSVLFGSGGASTQLFVSLARLPLLGFPAVALRARVQPLLVAELAEAVKALLTRQPDRTGVTELAGPRPLTVAEYVASLREQRGASLAHVHALPDWLTRLSVLLGDALPVTPWGSEALALLTKDNVSRSVALAELLGRAPTDPDRFLSSER